MHVVLLGLVKSTPPGTDLYQNVRLPYNTNLEAPDAGLWVKMFILYIQGGP